MVISIKSPGNNHKIIVFLLGPTAVGKSDVAFLLAREIGGEIVSCDAMQVYRELSVVSGKPPSPMLEAVTHHLINIASVREEFDVVKYYQLAESAIRDIHQRGKIPIVAGGSAMYMQVLLDGIFPGPAKDNNLRMEFLAQRESLGKEFLYDQLKEQDPIAASRIHPHDLKRVIRALEVCVKTGRPISELQPKRQGLWGEYDIRLFALRIEREKLYERINERVDKMFHNGAIEEVKQLAGEPLSLTASALIGVKEIKRYLAGEFSLEEAKELMKRNTRRFAKRQLTWYRREKRIHWLEMDEQNHEGVVRRIISDITITTRRSGEEAAY